MWQEWALRALEAETRARNLRRQHDAAYGNA